MPARPAVQSRVGLPQGAVHLAPHTAAWATAYERERRRIVRAFAGERVEVEHIGSTAIPNMPAKPIIDLAVRVTNLTRLRSCARRLRRLGYDYWGEYGLRGRHFFVCGVPVTHHLHLVGWRSRHWKAWLLFRDYLRDHTAAAHRYRSLKRRLSTRYPHERAAYTRAKTAFVGRILIVAGRSLKHKKR
jgi:GrpB-like predicted nucleotidyltransferase (UPF0157 family)